MFKVQPPRLNPWCCLIFWSSVVFIVKQMFPVMWSTTGIHREKDLQKNVKCLSITTKDILSYKIKRMCIAEDLLKIKWLLHTFFMYESHNVLDKNHSNISIMVQQQSLSWQIQLLMSSKEKHIINYCWRTNTLLTHAKQRANQILIKHRDMHEKEQERKHSFARFRHLDILKRLFILLTNICS